MSDHMQHLPRESEHSPHDAPQPRQGSFLTSRAGLVTIAFLAIAAFLLLSEHRAHALGFVPWLLLLACPLLHMFGHGGHSGHSGSPDDDRKRPHQH